MTMTVYDSSQTALDRRDWTDPCIEPTLAELLSDPMMDLVFRRDSLRRDHVEKLLRDQAVRLAAENAYSSPCGRC